MRVNWEEGTSLSLVIYSLLIFLILSHIIVVFWFQSALRSLLKTPNLFSLE